MVRLVKGAYWDTEIKRAQARRARRTIRSSRARPTPTFRTSPARTKLLAARRRIYPQFATHNAHTIAAIQWRGRGMPRPFEFQRLHGMGEELYEEVVGAKRSAIDGRAASTRRSAAHEDLLAYLVRRLLENGANTSLRQPHRRREALDRRAGRRSGRRARRAGAASATRRHAAAARSSPVRQRAQNAAASISADPLVREPRRDRIEGARDAAAADRASGARHGERGTR